MHFWVRTFSSISFFVSYFFRQPSMNIFLRDSSDGGTRVAGDASHLILREGAGV